jgi:Nucleotidyl transferase AbiEii toxin, Type IV TA system
MNRNYATIIGATEAERRDLFLTTAARMGTAIQNVEKDFWVCWSLDALFNSLDPGGPRLLFKGGTSLSKAFGLIQRFSEDIDITVFRGDLGQDVQAETLNSLTGKQRRKRLDAIREACQAYLHGPFTQQINRIATDTIGKDHYRLETDPDDKDRQTLLLWYPTVTAREPYIRSAVKIESGAKSALDPNTSATVTPYVADDVPDLDLRVAGITTVRPEWTLWDKIAILHGLRQWYERRGELKQGGQRISRHYHDVFRMMQDPLAKTWIADRALGADCVLHARLFFGSPDLGLETARPGSFTLNPTAAMREALTRDYTAMVGMVLGDPPSIDEVLQGIDSLERVINAGRSASSP